MENDRNGTLALVTGVVLIILAVFLVFASSQNSMESEANKKLSSQSAHYVTLISDTKRDTLAYTPTAVNQQIKKENISVNKGKERVRLQLGKGFSQTYGKTQNMTEYNQLKNDLPGLLGKQLSNKLIELSKPVLGQDGKQKFPFEKLNSVSVAFGKYQIGDNTIPVYAVLNYSKPTTNVTLTGSNSVEVSTDDEGQDMFQLTYNLKSQKYTLNDYVAGSMEGGN